MCCGLTFVHRDPKDKFVSIMEKAFGGLDYLLKTMRDEGVVWEFNAFENHECKSDIKFDEQDINEQKLSKTLKLTFLMKKHKILNIQTLNLPKKPLVTATTNLRIGDIIEISETASNFKGKWKLVNDEKNDRICYQWVKCDLNHSKQLQEMTLNDLTHNEAKLIAYQIVGEHREPAQNEIVYLTKRNQYGVIQDDTNQYSVIIAENGKREEISTKDVLNECTMLLLNGDKLSRIENCDYTGLPCYGNELEVGDEVSTVNNTITVIIKNIFVDDDGEEKYKVTKTNNIKRVKSELVFCYDDFLPFVFVLRSGNEIYHDILTLNRDLPNPIEDKITLATWCGMSSKSEIEDLPFVYYLEFRYKMYELVLQMQKEKNPINANNTQKWTEFFNLQGLNLPKKMFTKPQYLCVVKFWMELKYSDKVWSRLDFLNLTVAGLMKCVLCGVYRHLFSSELPKARCTPDSDEVVDALLENNNTKVVNLCYKRELHDAHLFANWLNPSINIDTESLTSLLKIEKYGPLQIDNLNIVKDYISSKLSGHKKWSKNRTNAPIGPNEAYYKIFNSDNKEYIYPQILNHKPLKYLFTDNLQWLKDLPHSSLILFVETFNFSSLYYNLFDFRKLIECTESHVKRINNYKQDKNYGGIQLLVWCILMLNYLHDLCKKYSQNEETANNCTWIEWCVTVMDLNLRSNIDIIKLIENECNSHVGTIYKILKSIKQLQQVQLNVNGGQKQRNEICLQKLWHSKFKKAKIHSWLVKSAFGAKIVQSIGNRNIENLSKNAEKIKNKFQTNPDSLHWDEFGDLDEKTTEMMNNSITSKLILPDIKKVKDAEIEKYFEFLFSLMNKQFNAYRAFDCNKMMNPRAKLNIHSNNNIFNFCKFEMKEDELVNLLCNHNEIGFEWCIEKQQIYLNDNNDEEKYNGDSRWDFMKTSMKETKVSMKIENTDNALTMRTRSQMSSQSNLKYENKNDLRTLKTKKYSNRKNNNNPLEEFERLSTYTDYSPEPTTASTHYKSESKYRNYDKDYNQSPKYDNYDKDYNKSQNYEKSCYKSRNDVYYNESPNGISRSGSHNRSRRSRNRSRRSRHHTSEYSKSRSASRSRSRSRSRGYRRKDQHEQQRTERQEYLSDQDLIEELAERQRQRDQEIYEQRERERQRQRDEERRRLQQLEYKRQRQRLEYERQRQRQREQREYERQRQQREYERKREQERKRIQQQQERERYRRERERKHGQVDYVSMSRSVSRNNSRAPSKIRSLSRNNRSNDYGRYRDSRNNSRAASKSRNDTDNARDRSRSRNGGGRYRDPHNNSRAASKSRNDTDIHELPDNARDRSRSRNDGGLPDHSRRRHSSPSRSRNDANIAESFDRSTSINGACRNAKSSRSRSRNDANVEESFHRSRSRNDTGLHDEARVPHSSRSRSRNGVGSHDNENIGDSNDNQRVRSRSRNVAGSYNNSSNRSKSRNSVHYAPDHNENNGNNLRNRSRSRNDSVGPHGDENAPDQARVVKSNENEHNDRDVHSNNISDEYEDSNLIDVPQNSSDVNNINSPNHLPNVPNNVANEQNNELNEINNASNISNEPNKLKNDSNEIDQAPNDSNQVNNASNEVSKVVDSQNLRLEMALGSKESVQISEQSTDVALKLWSPDGARTIKLDDKLILLDCIITNVRYKVIDIDYEKFHLTLIAIGYEQAEPFSILFNRCGYEGNYVPVFDQSNLEYWPVSNDLILLMRSENTVRRYINELNVTDDTVVEWYNANIFGETCHVRNARISQETSGQYRHFYEIQVEFPTGKGVFWIPTRFLKHAVGNKHSEKHPSDWCKVEAIRGNDGSNENGILIYTNVFRNKIVELNEDETNYAYITSGEIEWTKVEIDTFEDSRAFVFNNSDIVSVYPQDDIVLQDTSRMLTI